MYTSYASATLALRAKASFSYTHLPLSAHHPDSPCCCHCRRSCTTCESSAWLPLYSVSITPRSVYWLHSRHSILLHRAPSRSLLAAARFHRARAPCGPHGGIEDMIGLLAEAEGHFGDFGCPESSREEEEAEVQRKPPARSNYFGSARKRNGEVRKCEKRWDSKKESEFRERDGNARASSSRKIYEVQTRDREEGEVSRGGYWEVARPADVREVDTKRVGRVNLARDAREVRKYEEDSEGSRKISEFREREGSMRSSSSRKCYEVETRDREEEEESTGGYREVARTADVREVDTWRVCGRMNSAIEARENSGGERQRVVGRREPEEGSGNLKRIHEVRWDGTEKAFGLMNKEEGINGSQKVAGQVESREESRRAMRASDIHKDNRKMSSTSRESAREGREEYVREEQCAFRQRESREESRKFAGASEVCEDNTLRTSNTKSVVDTKLVDKEASSSSTIKNHSFVDNQIVGDTTSSRSSKRLTDVSEIHDSNIERASRSRRHFAETRMQDSEDISTSLQVTRDKKTRINIEETENIDLNQQHVYNVNVRTAHVSGTERASSSRSRVDATIGNQVDYTSSVKQIHDAREQQNQSTQQVLRQRSSRKEPERSTNTSQFSRSNTERISNRQETFNARTENREETSSLVFARDKRDEHSTGMGESSQSTQTRTAYSASLNGDSSSIHTLTSGLNDQIGRDEMYRANNDVMESVRRSDKSSARYVGEFVNRLQQELSSDALVDTDTHYPEIQMEKFQQGTSQSSVAVLGGLDSTTESRDKKLIQESARQSSSRSGPKGPSDEMWDVRGHISEEPPRREPEENASPKGVVDSTNASERTEYSNASERTESAITRRAHGSLWTYIADIIRKSWHANVGTHNSATKSGARSSSNESVSSEAWFSGHELDENDDETEKGERNGEPKESMPNKKPADQYPVSSGGGSEAPLPGGNTLLEAGTSTSTGSMERGPLSKVASLVSRPEHPGSIEGERGKQGVPSRVATVDQSSSLTGLTASATVEQEITEIDMPGSGSAKLVDELIQGKLPDIGGIEEKDGELKLRKLQRNKQVMRERFDEWEEAYKRESEQRKVDEFFMREAMLEAKKAADMWEVPVGAVLVQNGKIIARGCNLVEELRDSTAHAEMICIKEASNLLRTWRLAETTLYVTLEPCAMCAGAILQARIDTVVWGAPNKLLGADGSWVRLFPGDGGSNNLDPSKHLAGPVHPFHPKITIRRGILSTECADVMQQFFQIRRKNKKLEPSPPSCLPISTQRPKLFTKMHDIFCMMFCL